MIKGKITEEHIRKGKKCSSTDCPLALAIGPCFVSVGAVHFKDLRSIELTPELKQFVRNFDLGLPVEPMEFEL